MATDNKTIKIYKNDLSYPARSSVIMAKLLQLDYSTQDVYLKTGDHMTPEYLEMNPMHTVPVLEDGDFVLAGSHAIISYLASKYGTAEQREKLYPSDLQKRATINQRMFFESSHLMALAKWIVKDIIAGIEAPTIKQIESMDDGYSILEKYLQKTQYVAADHFTIADLSLVVAMSSVSVIVPVHAKYIKIHAWWKLLKDEDWYKKINEPEVAKYESWIRSFMKPSEKGEKKKKKGGDGDSDSD